MHGKRTLGFCGTRGGRGEAKPRPPRPGLQALPTQLSLADPAPSARRSLSTRKQISQLNDPVSWRALVFLVDSHAAALSAASSTLQSGVPGRCGTRARRPHRGEPA